MQDLNDLERMLIWLVLLISFAGLGYAIFLRQQVLREDTGTPAMRKVWQAIKSGALAYLGKQARSIIPLIGVLTVALFLSVLIVPPSKEAVEHFHAAPFNVQDNGTITLIIAFGRAVAFIMGALFSLTVGQLGMRMAVDANVRVAAEARKSFAGALRIAYRAGTVTGMLTDGLGLFGGTIIFIIFGKAAPDALLGFGFGGTLLALFMRVGGGIYTKAADVGADLVGKVEQNLEEDDKRNAAVIADLVGDNVGDCAGMAADIFESYEVTIVSGLILGLALVSLTGSVQWIVFPLIVRGIGVLSSIIGTYLVRVTQNTARGAMQAINRGFYSSAAFSLVLFAIMTALYMRTNGQIEWRPLLSVAIGVFLAIIIDKITEYFTDTHFRPVKDIAKATGGGPATTILSGMALGKESAVWSTLVIAATIFASILIWGSEAKDTGTYILYGVAMTGVGMLTLTGNNVAMDSFGPISDNANGVAEMADVTEGGARQILADLDAVGNTTKAITKGVAIGSAVIAAVSLFGSFLTDVGNVQRALNQPLLQGINVANPLVFIGLLIGGTVPWLFSSIAIKAVERAAGLIVNEVRRQFRDPAIMAYEKEPDYAHAVAISTSAAQRELLTLSIISVTGPIIVGLLLGVEALGGFLAGIILSGQLLAVYMANAGGAWDNAKKTIEDEKRDAKANTGKGSERHKAAVVGDTVGDPLKDTAGPALNPMIKVINLVSVIIAPIVVTTKLNLVTGVIVGALVAAFIWAVWQSKREASMV
ncbi:MAG: sodium-translocating pyrophosphatase [Thermoflexales bacterium]|nr:sodium-translocating pyrophosphatase [Thermoflexales bacterium]